MQNYKSSVNATAFFYNFITFLINIIIIFCLFIAPVTFGRCVRSKLISLLFLFSQPYLRNHPGLKERLCCGDVTLIFRHTPSLADCDESVLEKVEALNDSAEPEVRPSSFPEPHVPLCRRGPGTSKILPPFARVMAPSAEMNRQLWEREWGEATSAFYVSTMRFFCQMELYKFSIQKLRRIVCAI